MGPIFWKISRWFTWNDKLCYQTKERITHVWSADFIFSMQKELMPTAKDEFSEKRPFQGFISWPATWYIAPSGMFAQSQRRNAIRVSAMRTMDSQVSKTSSSGQGEGGCEGWSEYLRTLLTLSARYGQIQQITNLQYFSDFPEKIEFDVSCKLYPRRQFAWNFKFFFFLEKKEENMKCKILFRFEKMFQNVVCWKFYPAYWALTERFFLGSSNESVNALFCLCWRNKWRNIQI